ncbi:hypothetical protein [Nocardia sp. NRRL S-836]|uniref:hypothetical protein n=1 Tax=Nocardia sp. NRRL S-836 TaxID=1519492 RepID=UPI0006AEF702|nr:hypothetical protein [Nocardia sp. NRRL S-836]KOV84492.1 hypothetical protein ADL03_16530 [Nocardia sp. NRRL S-836]
MRRLGLLLLLCLALTGCDMLNDQTTLHFRLAEAGYTTLSSYHSISGEIDHFEVTASSADRTRTTEQLAEVVWDAYPQHVDHLSVTLNGTSEVYSAEQLQQAFGDRQVTEKPDDDAEVNRTIMTWLTVAAVVVLLVLSGWLVLVGLRSHGSPRRGQQPPTPQQTPPRHNVYLVNPPPGPPPTA